MSQRSYVQHSVRNTFKDEISMKTLSSKCSLSITNGFVQESINEEKSLSFSIRAHNQLCCKLKFRMHAFKRSLLLNPAHSSFLVLFLEQDVTSRSFTLEMSHAGFEDQRTRFSLENLVHCNRQMTGANDVINMSEGKQKNRH